MAALVYGLCAITALACCLLLLRGYWQTRTRLLLWTGVSFGALALSHIILVFDLVIVRDIDLFPLRNATTLSAIVILLYGLIWESK